MAIDNLILDFDGTLTNTEKEAEPMLIKWEELFCKRTGMPKEALIMTKEIEKEVLSDPKAGWTNNGLVIAPATADPYVLNRAIYAKMMSKLRAADPGKYDIPAEGADSDAFLNKLFSDSYSFAGTVLRDGAIDFLNKLINNFNRIIVTNSKTDAVSKKLGELKNYYLLYGDAKKYVVDMGWDKVPESIQPNGFPRPVLLRRKKYYDVLDNLRCEKAFEPDNTAVVGDIFELDLALPQYLGYRVVLLKTNEAQKYEERYLKSSRNSFVAKDYKEVIECLNG